MQKCLISRGGEITSAWAARTQETLYILRWQSACECEVGIFNFLFPLCLWFDHNNANYPVRGSIVWNNFLRTSVSRPETKLICDSIWKAAAYRRLIHTPSPQGVNKAAPLEAQFWNCIGFQLCIAEQGNFTKLPTPNAAQQYTAVTALLSVLFELQKSKAAARSIT